MDPTILIIMFSVSFALNIGLTWVSFRLLRRLLNFDELFQLFLHDIDTNIRYFDSVQGSPLLSNAQEVVEADKNMRIMRGRLEEYVLQIDELRKTPAKKKLNLPKKAVSPDPPVVL